MGNGGKKAAGKTAKRGGDKQTAAARRPAVAVGRLGPAFERDSRATLVRLRDAFAAVIEAVPGETRRAADLRRTLDLDAALAWQVHSVSVSEDPLSVARLVPKAGAAERFFRAVDEASKVKGAGDGARSAYAAFERLVEEHAGDRQSFDAMVSALQPDAGLALERLRRQAFKANSAVWGVRSRCALHSVVFYERPTGVQDCFSVRGRVDLRKLQRGAAVSIYASGRTWGGSTCPADTTTEGVSIDRCELLPGYCSQPVPRVRGVLGADGVQREFLELDGLGRGSQVTVFWKNFAPAFPGASRTPPHGMTTPCLEPTECMISDLLLPRGWTNPATAKVWVTPESGRYSTAMPGDEPYRLPFEGGAEHLGTSLAALHTPEAPRYAELMESELSRLGWTGTEFDIYRCVVAYPALYSAVHMCIEG